MLRELSVRALAAPLAELARLCRAARPLRLARWPAQAAEPALPPGRHVALPGGGALFVREAGDGPPLVLLHPWSWTGDVAFAACLPSLARAHRVVSVDLRGHGRSVAIAGPVALGDFVDDLLALLDALALARAVLVGHSLGGIVAMATALRAPARVAGLVVGGASACYTLHRRDRLVWRALRAARPLAHRDLGRSLPLRYFLDSAARSAVVARQWRWLEAELGRHGARAMWEVGHMVARLDLRDALARRDRRVPAAYLVCTRDTICHPALQRDTAARLGAAVVPVAADHDVPVSAPDAYLAALRRGLAHVRGA